MLSIFHNNDTCLALNIKSPKADTSYNSRHLNVYLNDIETFNIRSSESTAEICASRQKVREEIPRIFRT